MASQKYIIGVLTLVILATSLYIILPDNVKIQVFPTYTKYSVWENGGWVVGATEYNYLYNGTKKLTAINRQVSNYTYGTQTIIFRKVIYPNNIYTYENYTFDGTVTDVSRVPISTQLECINCKGLTVQYDIKDLSYTGITRDAVSPELFGHRMKVEWEDGSTFVKITSLIAGKGRLTIKYKPLTDYEIYDVRVSDPTATPAGYWNFTADAKDSSGNGWNGTLNGSAVIVSEGYLGQGVRFDGISDWVEIKEDDTLDPFDNAKNFTMWAWVRLNYSDVSNTQRLIHKNGAYSLVFVTDFRIRVYNTTSSKEIQTGDVYNNNTWYFVTASYNMTTTTIYINGVKEITGTMSGNLADVSADLIFGLDEDLITNDFNGTMDEIGIVMEALPDPVIASMYLNYTKGDRPCCDITEKPTIYNASLTYSTLGAEEKNLIHVNVSYSTDIIDTVLIEVQFPNGTRKNFTATQ